jgi:chemotaxis regulatin CheY-phosphate phosphatase CheZ
MNRLDAANDNEMGRQITRTREIWQPRMARNLTDEDARQLLHNATGFFGVLAEWRQAELLAAANDCAAPVETNDGEVRHDR